MDEITFETGSGGVFVDLGFSPAEAAELNVKSALISAINETIKARALTQGMAARLCQTDQPTLSKVPRGRMESVTIDRLAAWLIAPGRTVEIRVRPYDREKTTGEFVVSPWCVPARAGLRWPRPSGSTAALSGNGSAPLKRAGKRH